MRWSFNKWEGIHRLFWGNTIMHNQLSSYCGRAQYYLTLIFSHKRQFVAAPKDGPVKTLSPVPFEVILRQIIGWLAYGLQLTLLCYWKGHHITLFEASPGTHTCHQGNLYPTPCVHHLIVCQFMETESDMTTVSLWHYYDLLPQNFVIIFVSPCNFLTKNCYLSADFCITRK